MTAGVIVQARLSSRRLPGKMLHELAGRPLIDCVLSRVSEVVGSGRVVVATSSEASDDRLATFCLDRGADVFRGSLLDVAERMHSAAQWAGLERFVRVSGDSPLIHPALIDRALALAEAADADVATNVFPRSFPKGQSVEVLRTAAVAVARERMVEAEDREHVTTHFYDDPTRWRISTFRNERDLSHLNMCVDTPADQARLSTFIAANPSCWAMSAVDLMHAFEDATAAHTK